MENLFQKILNILKLKKESIALSFLIVIVLIAIIAFLVSFGNNILPFIYSAF